MPTAPACRSVFRELDDGREQAIRLSGREKRVADLDRPTGDATARLCRRLDTSYGALEGAELLGLLIARVFRGRIALVSSFGAESAVLLHMVAMIDRRTPVIFLNTGKLFGETLAYREELAERLGLTDVRDIRPDPVDAGRGDPDGMLWNRDADACCWFRKVLPLEHALTGFSAWITGRKRFQGGERQALPVFEIDMERVKVNPLAGWAANRLRAYMEEHGLPAHPLTAQGYASIGCAPCSAPAMASEDPRAGRWQGMAKSECGIHFTEDGLARRTRTKPSPGCG